MNFIYHISKLPIAFLFFFVSIATVETTGENSIVISDRQITKRVYDGENLQTEFTVRKKITQLEDNTIRVTHGVETFRDIQVNLQMFAPINTALLFNGSQKSSFRLFALDLNSKEKINAKIDNFYDQHKIISVFLAELMESEKSLSSN